MQDAEQANTGQEQQATKPAPAKPKPKPKPLPPFKVILLNDDHNEFGKVIAEVYRLTPLNRQQATRRVLEAHTKGRSLLLTTHKERAELYQDQFASLVPPIGIDIEPGEA